MEVRLDKDFHVLDTQPAGHDHDNDMVNALSPASRSLSSSSISFLQEEKVAKTDKRINNLLSLIILIICY